MDRRYRITLAAVIAFLGAMLPAPAALASGCGNGPPPIAQCMLLGVADVANATKPATVDSVSGSDVMNGSRGWSFSMASPSSNFFPSWGFHQRTEWVSGIEVRGRHELPGLDADAAALRRTAARP